MNGKAFVPDRRAISTPTSDAASVLLQPSQRLNIAVNHRSSINARFLADNTALQAGHAQRVCISARRSQSLKETVRVDPSGLMVMLQKVGHLSSQHVSVTSGP